MNMSLFDDDDATAIVPKSEAVFANISYSEIESAGPPVAPLGFPAPRVLHSEVGQVLCLDTNKSAWAEQKAILIEDRPDVAYMLSSLELKQTICGEILKGVRLRRVNSIAALHALRSSNSSSNNCSSKMSSYHGNLWQMSETCVAIKVDRRKTMKHIHQRSMQRNPENPWKEVAAMQLLGNDHPHVMGLFGVFVDEQCLYEVMHFCSKGNLSSFMRQYPSGLAKHRARQMFSQILDGVYYIHSRGVCHHDLSTDNVMLDEDGNCIIIDFGMCLRIPYSYPDDPTGTTDDITDITIGTCRRLIHSQNHCGKLRFMAPEIYQKDDGFDGFASDLWSLGVILFVLLTGRQPYQRPDDKDAGYHDLTDPTFYWNIQDIDPCLSWGHDMSQASIDLLRNLLCPDPRNRATLGWTLKHTWLTDS